VGDETIRNVLTFAAVAEAAIGLGLLIVPSLLAQLLLGEQLAGIAIPVERMAGIALIALGIACWRGPPLARRNADLQHVGHAVSCLPLVSRLVRLACRRSSFT
jgi:hypothetical protein